MRSLLTSEWRSAQDLHLLGLLANWASINSPAVSINSRFSLAVVGSAEH
jgi:hypothetical protein